jgi:hypothetical protein
MGIDSVYALSLCGDIEDAFGPARGPHARLGLPHHRRDRRLRSEQTRRTWSSMTVLPGRLRRSAPRAQGRPGGPIRSRAQRAIRWVRMFALESAS